MGAYAIVMRNGSGSLDDVLVILDDRAEADEIAAELVRRGHDVGVLDVPATLGGRSSVNPP
jgi:hypothetical protein